MRVLKPDTDDQVVEAIRDAKAPLAVEGRGTKSGFGRKVAAETMLRLAGLSGITMYEPDEMVFTARAGTPLAEVEETLAAKGQCLAFEPGEIGKLWQVEEGATIGGTVAAAIAGPRRFAAGAARDHLLGFVAVNGKGERFKAGGRVVKNVTGYDLPKLAAGSFGTLFAMTELTLRAVPRAATLVLAREDKDPAAALKTLRDVAGSPFEPSGLVHLSAPIAERLTGAARALTLIRLEGQGEGVDARAAELTRSIAARARVFDRDDGAKLFRAVSDVHPMFEPATSVWRLSVPPSHAFDAITRLNPTTWCADAAGGIVWLDFAEAADVAHVHTTAGDLGGHATLYRAGAATADAVFPPLETPALDLTARVKQAFDPARILNPGRMYKGV